MLQKLLSLSLTSILVSVCLMAFVQAKAQVGQLTGQRSSVGIWHGKYSQVSLTTQDRAQAQAAIASVSPAVVSIYGYADNDHQNVSVTDSFPIPIFSSDPLAGLDSGPTQVDAGTGFFVDQRGYILTAAHVVTEPATSFVAVTNDGDEHPAQVLYRDKTHDIAVLKIEGSSYPTLALGDSSQLSQGQVVVGIGNAFGQISNLPSVGAVVPMEQNVVAASDPSSGEQLPVHLFQTSMQLYPGDSGGPTFDLKGHVVGINDAIAMDEPDISFSVPINDAKSALNRIIPPAN